MTQTYRIPSKVRRNRVAVNTQAGYVPESRRLRELMDEKRRIEIGTRLRAFRGQMRQHQAAEKLHVSERTYQTWELGEAATSLENYERMAKLYGVSVTDILGNESGAPAWAVELKAQFDRMEGEFAELRAMIAQLTVARALAVDPPGHSEGLSEAEEVRESNPPQ